MNTITVQCSNCDISIDEDNAKLYQTKLKDKLKFALPDKILFCKNCQMGTAIPFVKESDLKSYYDNVSSHWGDLSSLKGPKDFLSHYSLSQSKLDYFLRFSKSSLEGKVLIDIGGGNGALGFALLSKKIHLKEYILFDLDKLVLKKAKEMWPKDAIFPIKTISDIEELRENQKFDVLFFSHVLEHVYTPQNLIKSLFQYLKTGGYIFLEVPNSDYRFKGELFPHLVFFTPKTFEVILKNLNFTLINCSIVGENIKKSIFNVDSKSKQKVETLLNRFSRKVPLSLSTHLIKTLYKSDRTSNDGPWIRCLGVKK